MTERITMQQLEDLITDPDVPKSDLSRYFKLNENPREPFIPEVELSEETVEVKIVRGDKMINWLNNLYAKRRQNAYNERIQAGWQGLRFVAEGDSWFQYPHPFDSNDDIIEYLSKPYAVYCVSAAGDMLSSMMSNIDNLVELVKEEQPNGLLFSGGGNDIAGPEFISYVRGYDPQFQAANYISVQYTGFLRRIEEHYEELLAGLTTSFPDLKIFYHGYDWAFPRVNGTWLGPHLKAKEIEEKYWADIIRIMIDRFNIMLIELAGRFPGQVYHVDCRGAIGGRFEWRDELHGKPRSVGRAAKRFERVIEQAFSNTAGAPSSVVG